MIIKVSKMRSTAKSSIERVGRYITSTQGKQERLGRVLVLNCQSDTAAKAILEIKALQKMKVNVKGDKTLHLIASFHATDVLTDETLKKVTSEIINRLGYKGHQCLVAEHTDTDHRHLHIVVNKINPETGKMVEHWRAYKLLAEVAQELESTYKFVPDNHGTKQTAGASSAADLEAHRGQESFIGYLRNELKGKLSTIENWEQFHSILSAAGVTVKLRGNGLVFVDAAGLHVKASSVGREFSKVALEKKFGAFSGFSTPLSVKTTKEYRPRPLVRDDREHLYQEYLGVKDVRKATLFERLQQLKEWRAEQYESIRNDAVIAKTANRVMITDRTARRFANATVTETARQRREHLREEYQQKKDELFEKFGNRSWVDFLRDKAKAGDEASLTLLRNRPGTRVESGGNNISVGEKVLAPSRKSFADLPQDLITKRGTVIYSDGQKAVRDRGNQLQVSDAFDSDLIRQTLQEACARYSGIVTVNGSEEFKAAVVVAAARYGMEISFDDAEMNRSLEQLRTEVSEVYSNGRGSETRRSTQSDCGGLLFAGAQGRREDQFARKVRAAFVADCRASVPRHYAALPARSRAQPVAWIRSGSNQQGFALPRVSERLLGQDADFPGCYATDVHLQIRGRNGQDGDVQLGRPGRRTDHAGGGLRRLSPNHYGVGNELLANPENVRCNALVRELNAEGAGRYYRAFVSKVTDDVTFRGIHEFQGRRFVLFETDKQGTTGVCPLSELGWGESRAASLIPGRKIVLATGAVVRTGRGR